MIQWIKKHRTEFVIVSLIILLAAFLRFYKIDQYMTFLGDEGRDALVIKRILTEGDFPLLGPPTSIGNMYLGPLYYYMMAVPMFIFYMNPVAAAGMVALIGTLTVGLIYFLTKEWFGKAPAAFAAFLYAVSSVNIVYSRSSWNPNPAPFFALLLILSLHLAHKYKNYYWFILSGVALAFTVQMHYLALLLVPVAFVLWGYEFYLKHFRKTLSKNFWSGTIFGILSFLILMSPLVIFDFKYGFMNYRALTAFFSERQTTVNLNVFNTLERIVPVYKDNLVGSYITGENQIITIFICILIFIPLLLSLIYFFKEKKLNWPIFALGTWLLVGVLGLALYKQNIYDHYLGFLNPAPFILLGSLISFDRYLKKHLHLVIVVGLFLVMVAGLALINFLRSPLLETPNNQLKRTQDVAKHIIIQANGKPFNFALIAKSNYDSAYQFYLDIYGHRPGQLPFEKTEQLFVVCEDEVCNPINHSKFEIAAFGWGIIEKQEDVHGLKVFKLIHNPQEQMEK